MRKAIMVIIDAVGIAVASQSQNVFYSPAQHFFGENLNCTLFTTHLILTGTFNQ